MKYSVIQFEFKLTTTESRNKNRLKKIHRLKQENRVLSARRKALKVQLSLNQNIYLKTVVDCIVSGKAFTGLRESTQTMFNKDLGKYLRLSERIGKNGAKVQRLRTLIQQEKAREVKYQLKEN